METDPNKLAEEILAALNGHNYLLLAALLLVAAVYGVRWLAARTKDNKYAAWINTDRGGAVTALVLSVAGGLTTALKAGVPVNAALLLKMFVVATSGTGVFNLYKRIVKPSDKSTPEQKTEDTKQTPPTGAPPAAAILAIIMVTSFLACATMKAIAIDFASCELGKVPTTVSPIVGDVEKALEGDDANWQTDLENIGKKAGIDAVNCAVASILHNVGQTHGELTARAKTKVVRGRTWLATHGHAAVQ